MKISESQSGLANSFTDLMTSLAIIFILLLCITHNEAQQEGETTRNSILVEIKEELKEFIKKGVEVDPDPKDPLGLLILVPEGLLEFKPDRAEIPSKGIDFLRVFIPHLAKIVCDKRFREDINSIVLEGHTDSTGPSQRTDQYNWKLSQDRSMSVVAESLKLLENENPIISDLMDVRGQFVKLLSASGRGSAELMRKLSGEEDKAKSRRVVFRIRVRSLEQKVIKKFLP